MIITLTQSANFVKPLFTFLGQCCPMFCCAHWLTYMPHEYVLLLQFLDLVVLR